MQPFITFTKETLVLFLVAISLSYGSYAGPEAPQPSSTPETNPYIELYRLRVNVAELNLKRQQALQELARSKAVRGNILIQSRSISPEEYETLVSDFKVTKSDVELAEKKIVEAKTYLRIVEAVLKSGQKVPICTSEME